MNKDTYPLSLRKTKPHNDAELLLPGLRPDGLPDGIHTGGVYRWRELIWKPLDCRPYPNADFLCPTNEAIFLAEMADLQSFPCNWTVKIRNGRRWLIRPEAIVLDSVNQYRTLQQEVILQIEQDVMAANCRGWEVNDVLILAFDKDIWNYFILDCSAAQKMTGKGAWSANEFDRIMRLFELCGMDRLIKLRRAGRRRLMPFEFMERHPEQSAMRFKHVYASFNRPLSPVWARIDQSYILEHQSSHWSEGIPHTWILTKKSLPPKIVDSYELTWAYSDYSDWTRNEKGAHHD